MRDDPQESLPTVPEARRTLQLEALRRFVPEAIARRIAQGDDADCGEREVSVLFVDLRQYTRLADGHDPREIFDFLSTYAKVLSEIVHSAGGSLVEFTGDGLMAVFGAPNVLAAKERAALASGLAMVDSISEFGLQVGVGVATGPAYVGTIAAADRSFWCAVGNTTILASRLQALSRDLGAAVVIDARTFEAAGEIDEIGFEQHPNVQIRGRRQPETVFALPRAVVAPAETRAPGASGLPHPDPSRTTPARA